MHTQAVEQAGRDRNLFLNSRGTRHVDLKFPEYVVLFHMLDHGRTVAARYSASYNSLSLPIGH